MGKLNLKSLIGRKNDLSAILAPLAEKLHAEFYLEDDTGKLLLGNREIDAGFHLPLLVENEVAGYFHGNASAASLGKLVLTLIQKEAEKKKLGSEVLNLYQEVNLIFNFSEKLAQTIDAASIASIALNETSHVINAEFGVVLLWDEARKRMQVVASKGDLFFPEEKVNENLSLLMSFAGNGQSEIVSDLSQLIEAGMVTDDLGSLIYSSLKVKHRIMGAIILAGKEKGKYSAADLKLLTTLALQSSSAIESALLYEKNIREAIEREEAMRRIYEVTGKFVPIEFIASLGHEFITDVHLGDQVEKIVTVLFSDIRDYTTLSEQMTPEENFRFICSFNERMGPLIRKHRGFINQYLGDAIMAIFPYHAGDALAAAIEMQHAVLEFNGQRLMDNQLPIEIGVGMHSGPLIMGITGDKDRLDATTISDTVNAASRIESLTKYFKANILISDATLSLINGDQQFPIRPLGPVQVKGKKDPLGIHECFGGNTPEEIEKKSATVELFREAITQYLNKAFTKAFIAFQTILEENPDDHTAKYFLGKTAGFITKGVPENWIGVEEMISK